MGQCSELPIDGLALVMSGVKLPSPEEEIKAVPSSKFGSLATPGKIC